MLPGGVDEGGLVVSPPFADVPPGAFDGSATAALALRSAASADAGELGVAVDPATDGPEVPLTPGSNADAVSGFGTSPRVNVSTAAAAIVVITAPVMMRGNGFLDMERSSCASASGSVPAAPVQIIGRMRPREIGQVAVPVSKASRLVQAQRSAMTENTNVIRLMPASMIPPAPLP